MQVKDHLYHISFTLWSEKEKESREWSIGSVKNRYTQAETGKMKQTAMETDWWATWCVRLTGLVMWLLDTVLYYRSEMYDSFKTQQVGVVSKHTSEHRKILAWHYLLSILSLIFLCDSNGLHTLHFENFNLASVLGFLKTLITKLLMMKTSMCHTNR